MAWRGLFLAGGLLIAIGGPMHPMGPMVEMLAHPDWLMAHALVTAGFTAMLAGLMVFAREARHPAQVVRWTRYLLMATVVQTVDYVIHTAAMVDAGHLAAGHSTPVLTTHMMLSVIAYPLFGAALIGFILAVTRARAIGSKWIAWLGLLGAAGHGLSTPMTAMFGDPMRVLFPMTMGIALWLIFAAVWPTFALRASVGKPATQA